MVNHLSLDLKINKQDYEYSLYEFVLEMLSFRYSPAFWFQ